MKQKFLSVLLIALATSFSNYIFAQDSIYVLDKNISIPGNSGYDYLSIDTMNRKLYVSHGTSVNVIDLNKEQVIGSIDSMKGVHGIAIVNEINRGFISDGKGNAIVVFDLTSLKTITTIPLSEPDADAIIYDPYSKKIFAFCGDGNSTCVVDINTLKQIVTIPLGGAPEFAVSDHQGLIYNNLEDKSSLNVIDVKTMKVIHTYSLSPCGGPTGLALDKNNKRLFTVCRENKGMSVVDINSGKVITTVPIGAGVDAVVYDSDNKLILVSNGDGTATVIKQNSADDYKVIQTIQTTYRAKTMALDPQTHKIYFSAAQYKPGTKTIIPETFAVWVYKLNR